MLEEIWATIEAGRSRSASELTREQETEQRGSYPETSSSSAWVCVTPAGKRCGP
jgi:hypothetical protein